MLCELRVLPSAVGVVELRGILPAPGARPEGTESKGGNPESTGRESADKSPEGRSVGTYDAAAGAAVEAAVLLAA